LAGASFPTSCATTDFSSPSTTEFTILSSYIYNIAAVTYSITDTFTIPIYTMNVKVVNLANIYLGSSDECPTVTGV
jgi:hypothetical protein